MITAMDPRRNARVRRRLLTWLLAFLATARPIAHDLERTTVHLRVAADGSFTLRLAHDPSWLLLRMETFAGGSSVSTSDPAARDARLRALAPQAIDRVVLFVDGHEVRPLSSEYTPPPSSAPAGEFALASYTLRGFLPVPSHGLRWYYGLVADPYPLTVELADATSTTELVQGDAWSTTITLGGHFARPPLLTRLGEYAAQGFTYVFSGGIEHTLFVVGLFLLGARWQPVLAQLILFTSAYSLTLGLSLSGLLSLPARSVELLLAISIAYVAVENILTETLTTARLVLVFLFGLLHGVGLAGVLTSLLAGRGDVAAGVPGFTLGVVLGQLSVIGAMMLLVGWCRDRIWYHSRVVVPASLGVAGVAVCAAVFRLLR